MYEKFRCAFVDHMVCQDRCELFFVQLWIAISNFSEINCGFCSHSFPPRNTQWTHRLIYSVSWWTLCCSLCFDFVGVLVSSSIQVHRWIQIKIVLFFRLNLCATLFFSSLNWLWFFQIQVHSKHDIIEHKWI